MRRAAFALPLVVLAGCSLFTSLEDFDGDGTGEADAATPDGLATANDSGTTPGTDGSADADASAPTTPSETYRAAVLADQPIAYFRFEETSGTSLKDETNGHTGTAFGSPTLTASGLFGPTDGIELPADSKAHVRVDGTDVRFAGSMSKFTVEAWVFPTKFQDYQWIASTEEPFAPRSGWSIFASSTATASYEAWATELRALYLSAKPLVLGKWQHVVFTYNGIVLTGYVDGVKVQTTEYTTTMPDIGQLTFGCRLINGNPSECLQGWKLDEIALYSDALTVQRVKAHYDLGAPK